MGVHLDEFSSLGMIFVRPPPQPSPVNGGGDPDWVLAITTSHPILAFHLKLVLLSSPSQPFRAPSPSQGGRSGWGSN